MEKHRRQLLRCSLVTVLLAGWFSFCAYAEKEATGVASPEASRLAEGAVPMRGVLNSFSHVVNDWYASAYPQLQRFYNANMSYLPYGGSVLKFPGFNNPPQMPVSSQGPLAMLPGQGGFNPGMVFQVPSFVPPRVNSTSADSGKGGVENADAQAALVTALNAFHQYVDNFINSLALKLSPYLVHYTPAGFFPFLPGPIPVPIPAAPPILPSPLDPNCLQGDGKCLHETAVRPSGPFAPAPEADMAAIIELLSRFGGKLSSSHIVALQPLMEQYVARLSAKSRAALRPWLFQYWPQLFPSGDEGTKQPGGPLPPPKPRRSEEPRGDN